jgi:hypothetical protein
MRLMVIKMEGGIMKKSAMMRIEKEKKKSDKASSFLQVPASKGHMAGIIFHPPVQDWESAGGCCCRVVSRSSPAHQCDAVVRKLHQHSHDFNLFQYFEA